MAADLVTVFDGKVVLQLSAKRLGKKATETIGIVQQMTVADTRELIVLLTQAADHAEQEAYYAEAQTGSAKGAGQSARR
jgi:hypothetical protein